MGPSDTRVRAVMTEPVRTVAPDLPAADAAEVMLSEEIGSVVVEGDPPGVVTKTDLVAGLREGSAPGTTPVADLMTSDPVTVDADADLQTAVDAMEAHGVKRLPVVADGGDGVVGIVTTTDLVGEFARDHDTVAGMFVEPRPADRSHTYECVDCGRRESAESRPEACPNCGARVRNIGVPRE
ncbi:MAG: rubrerythrin-like domain-containing protein [Halobacteriales archaeon]